MTRKTVIIICAIIVFLILTYFTVMKAYPALAFKIAAINAIKKYPREIVENAEKIFRMETSHFTSLQFLKTWSPGMEKFGASYPYGWTTLDKVFWSKNPIHKPIGTYTMPENKTGITKTFLQFRTLTDSLMTVCAFLENNGNNPAAWYSKNLESQARYQKTLDGIIPRTTNEIPA
jgi:hypothetical protein